MRVRGGGGVVCWGGHPRSGVGGEAGARVCERRCGWGHAWLIGSFRSGFGAQALIDLSGVLTFGVSWLWVVGERMR